MTNGTGEKKSGCGKYILIGCGVLLILGIMAAVGGVFAVRGLLRGAIESYTDTEPLELPQVQMEPARVQEVMQRVGTFRGAVEAGRPTQPLVLNEDEVNALIQNDPLFADLAGKVHVSIEGSTIRGDVSIPLDRLISMTKGRYLNGSAEITVSLVSGRPMVFLESMTVKDKEVPQEVIRELGKENLAKEFADDPEFKRVWEKLESVDVRDGQLIIVPKNTTREGGP